MAFDSGFSAVDVYSITFEVVEAEKKLNLSLEAQYSDRWPLISVLVL